MMTKYHTWRKEHDVPRDTSRVTCPSMSCTRPDFRTSIFPTMPSLRSFRLQLLSSASSSCNKTNYYKVITCLKCILTDWNVTTCSVYLWLSLQKHGLPVLRLHLGFYRLVLLGGRLAGQRVGQLDEEQLLRFAQAPSVQQVRENFRLRERRTFESGFSLFYLHFLWLLFHCRRVKTESLWRTETRLTCDLSRS